MNRMFDWTVKRGNETAWIASSDKEAGSIKIVKAILAKNTPLVTKRCAEAHGGITRKATIWNKHKAAGSGCYKIWRFDICISFGVHFAGI